MGDSNEMLMVAQSDFLAVFFSPSTAMDGGVFLRSLHFIEMLAML